MPKKIAKSAPSANVRAAKMPVAVRSSRLSCRKAGKVGIFTKVRESSGESQIISIRLERAAYLAGHQQGEVSGNNQRGHGKLDLAMMLILNIIAAILLGPLSSGSSQTPTGGTTPVVTARTCTVSSGFSNGQNVIQTHSTGACNFPATCGGIACTGIDAITSWAIISQSCASRYSITAAGILQGGANAANMTNETDTVTLTATNSTGTSPAVVQTVVAYADGSPAAPSGTPQYPTLLSGGGYSRQSYSATPPWNVAGVDYAVGCYRSFSHCSIRAEFDELL
jgi:hypothetical protein